MMIARVFLSLIPMEEDNPVMVFILCVTEPLVIPMRAFLSLFFDVYSLPVDVSYFIVFALLGILIRTVS